MPKHPNIITDVQYGNWGNHCANSQT